MRKAVYILALLSSLGFGESWAQVMTMKECIQVGIANNLTLRNAQMGVEQGRVTISQSRARRQPTVNGMASATGYILNPVNVTTGALLGNDFPDDPTWQMVKSMPYNANIGIAVSMPLLDHTVSAATEAAETMAELRTLSLEQAKEQLTIQIAKAYCLAQATKGQAALLAANIQRMQELCDITQAMLDEGVAMEVDLSRVRINLQNIITERDRYITLHEQQLNLLRFLLDLPTDEPLEVEDLPTDYQSTTVTAADLTLPEILVAAKQKELAEKNIHTVRAAYQPTLSASGYLGAIGYQDRTDRFFHGHSAHANWFGNSFLSVSLRVPIYDGRQKHLRIRQLQYDAQMAANSMEQQRRQTLTLHANHLQQLRHEETQLRLQRDNVRQAVAVYRVAADQYLEGVTSMSILLQDEMRLRNAKQSALQAQTQCMLTRIDLLRLMGELSELTK